MIELTIKSAKYFSTSLMIRVEAEISQVKSKHTWVDLFESMV
jgi:hypothetical protein